MAGEQNRRARAAASLELTKTGPADALYVTNPHNVRYLTGFTGSNGTLLLFRDGRGVFFTDPRYTVQSKQQVPDCKVVIAKGPLSAAALGEIGRAKVKRVGFEDDHLTVSQLLLLQKGLPVNVELVPASGIVERLRAVKDAGEIELIRASVKSNSQALEAALKRFRTGMTESDLAGEIDHQNRKLGAEGPAFDTIVAAGEHAALPHAHPGKAKIGPGILLIDMGAMREGYASDMTRMVYVGRATPKYKQAYKAVLEAQLAAIDAIRAGVVATKVDLAARRTLKKHGLDKEFIHSTGHGLGLGIHEPPRIGQKDKSKAKLETGMAITVEPGIYIEGWGGIRIEDTVVVTDTGCEILTPTSKELREI